MQAKDLQPGDWLYDPFFERPAVVEAVRFDPESRRTVVTYEGNDTYCCSDEEFEVRR